MQLRQSVPIYMVDVLVYIFENGVFLHEKIITDVMIKGYGKKGILEKKMDILIHRTASKVSISKKHTFKIQDIQLKSQHGFGVNLD